VNALYANAATSLLSISLTVLFIDRLYEQRDAQQLKKRLIWEMGSSDQAFTGRSVKELRDAGWLTDGSLEGLDFALANLQHIDLSGAWLRKSDLTSANLQLADLEGADLSGAVLDGCDAEKANFKVAIMPGASLRRSNLAGAKLDDAVMTGDIDLLRACMVGASLRGAKLAGARLEECDLTNCDLAHADLSGSTLRGAILQSASFENASLERVDLQDLGTWSGIRSISGAKISGIRNAPEGFRAWAVSNGAVE